MTGASCESAKYAVRRLAFIDGSTNGVLTKIDFVALLIMLIGWKHWSMVDPSMSQNLSVTAQPRPHMVPLLPSPIISVDC